MTREIVTRLEESLAKWEEKGRPSYLQDEAFWAEEALQPAIGELQVLEVRIGGFDDPYYCALHSVGRQIPHGAFEFTGIAWCCSEAETRIKTAGDFGVYPPRPQTGCATAGEIPANHGPGCLWLNWLAKTSRGGAGVFQVDDTIGALKVGGNWLIRAQGPRGVPVCLWWLTEPTGHNYPTSTADMRWRLETFKADQILAACFDPSFNPDRLVARFAELPLVRVCRGLFRRQSTGWEPLECASFELGTPRGGVFCGGFVDWTGNHRVGSWIASCMDGSCWSWRARASRLTSDDQLVVTVLHGGYARAFCDGW